MLSTLSTIKSITEDFYIEINPSTRPRLFRPTLAPKLVADNSTRATTTTTPKPRNQQEIASTTHYSGRLQWNDEEYNYYKREIEPRNVGACVLHALKAIFGPGQFGPMELFIAAQHKFISEGVFNISMTLADYYSTPDTIRIAIQQKFGTYHFERVPAMKRVSAMTLINWFIRHIKRDGENFYYLIIGTMEKKVNGTHSQVSSFTPSYDHCCAVVHGKIYNINNKRALLLTTKNVSKIFSKISRVYKIGRNPDFS